MTHQKQGRPLVGLVRERLNRNWSQQEVADRVGTTAGNVSRWERGANFPNPYFRQKLCKIFGLNAEELGLQTAPLASCDSEEPGLLTVSPASCDSEPHQRASRDEEETALPVQEQPEAPPEPPLEEQPDHPTPPASRHRSVIQPPPRLMQRLQQYPRRSIGVIALSIVSGITLLVALLAARAPSLNSAQAVHMTATAGPTPAEATAIMPGWTKGQPVFSDSLKDTSPTNTRHGWTISSGTTGCKFSQMYQYYQVQQEGLGYCYYGRRSWSDLAYEVDISVHQGNQGGVVLRLNSTLNSYYYFSITKSGEYDFTLVLHGSANSLASGFSPYIKRWPTNPVWNTLRILAQGPVFTFIVNNHHVATVTDKSLTEGAIGLAVSSSQKQFCLAQYQNAKVWVPG